GEHHGRARGDGSLPAGRAIGSVIRLAGKARGDARGCCGVAEAGSADPPEPTREIRTRAATSATWASATGRTAGPDSPPLPPPSHARALASPAPRARASARSVLTSDTASAPPASV